MTNNDVRKSVKIHRLVAKAFIPNNEDSNKNVVNHMNGDRLNNNVSNLEWVTTAENTKHGYDVGKNHVTKRRIQKLDDEGNVIEEFESFKEARERTGIDDGSIAKVCKGRQQTAGGFRWRFAEQNPNEVHDLEVDLSEAVEVNGFPNYQIFEDGQIYSIRFKKYLKSQTNADGYRSISLANNNVKKTFLVHRLVAEHFIPKIEGKDLVNHIDSNKQNNHVDNLEWCTNAENMKHAYKNKDKQKKVNDVKRVVKKVTIVKMVEEIDSIDIDDVDRIDDIENDVKVVIKPKNKTKVNNDIKLKNVKRL